MPVPRLGLRLDGRVFATFVEAEGRAIACSPGICLVAFDADIVLASRVHRRDRRRLLTAGGGSLRADLQDSATTI